MAKDILKFLFSESFDLSNDEVIADVFEKLVEIEDIEVKTGPLQKALKKLGYKGDVCVNPDGTAQICCDNDDDFNEIVRQAQSPDGLFQLAELGWVPDFRGDDAGALDTPHLVLGFISMLEPTASSDKDKLPELEKYLKDLDDKAEDDQNPGIGADVKIPKMTDLKKKDLKVKDTKVPKASIRDGLEEDDDEAPRLSPDEQQKKEKLATLKAKMKEMSKRLKGAKGEGDSRNIHLGMRELSYEIDKLEGK